MGQEFRYGLSRVVLLLHVALAGFSCSVGVRVQHSVGGLTGLEVPEGSIHISGLSVPLVATWHC